MHFFLALVLATSDSLYEKCPQAGPAKRTLSGDWIMSHERAERLACLIETCEARRLQFEVREKEQGAPAAWWAIVLVAVSSAVGGFFLARAIAPFWK